MPTKEPSVLNTTTSNVPVQDSLRLLAERNSSAAPETLNAHQAVSREELKPQNQATTQTAPAPAVSRYGTLLKRSWWGALAGTFLLGFAGIHWLQGAACLLVVGTVGAELKSGKRASAEKSKTARALAEDVVAWGRHLDRFEQK